MSSAVKPFLSHGAFEEEDAGSDQHYVISQ